MNRAAASTSSIDDAINAFEESWSADDVELISRICQRIHPDGRSDVIVELVRVDIGRRYGARRDVQLDGYFRSYPDAFSVSHNRVAVAYEDFRIRRLHGHSCDRRRWSGIEGLEHESWFAELPVELVVSRPETESAAWGRTTADGGLARHQPVRTTVDSDGRPVNGDDSSEWVGDFRVAAELGRGSFSRVCLARQRSLAGRFVAIKIVERPLNEAVLLASLQQTGIVPLHSCQRIGDRWVLCMPYSGAATLATWLNDCPEPTQRTGDRYVDLIQRTQQRVLQALEKSGETEKRPAPECAVADAQALRAWHDGSARPLLEYAGLSVEDMFLDVFRKLSAALAHAHLRGVIHGDLKPANILLRDDGEPALIDFNLSQATNACQAEWLGGTLPYMPAERLEAMRTGSTVPLRPSSDVFALGAIMYELVEGRIPFVPPKSASAADLDEAQSLRAIVPVFSKSVRATWGLIAIIHKCLHAAPERRYATAAELLDDVEAECTRRPLLHAQESFWKSRVPKLLRRYPRVFSTASMVAVSVVLISIVIASASKYRADSRRLQALNLTASLREVSDRLFAACLTTDATNSTRMGLTLECLETMEGRKTRRGLRDPQSQRSLTDAERTAAEQRALAAGFLASRFLELAPTHSPDPGRALVESSIQSTLNLLPADLRTSSVTTTPASSGSVVTGDAASADAVERVTPLLKAIDALAHRDAATALSHLDRIDPDESLSVLYWMTRGRAQLDLGDFRDAVSSFSMAAHELPDSPSAYFNRGLAWFRLGSLDQAIADFDLALERDVEFVAALVNRSAAFKALKQTDRSLEDLNQAVVIDPDSGRLRLIRARALRDAGRNVDADADFLVAMTLPPRSSDDWVSVALARLPENPQAALQDLLSAERHHGASPTVLQSLAHVYSEHLSQPDDAVQCLDRLLANSPKFARALGGRAVLHARAGRGRLAVDDVNRLLVAEPIPSGEALYQSACALALCAADKPALKSQSLSLLAKAVRAGYGGGLLDSDPDLENIRSTSEFAAIKLSEELSRSR